MKKIITIFLVLFSLSGFVPNNSFSQNNVVLEYCTGTWCQWCPCNHQIISDILANYPNTVVLAYHGGSVSDPWQPYSLGMSGLFGFNLYPTGCVGRKTGVVSNTAWNNEVVLQSLLIQPGVMISVSNKSYDAGTRNLSANITITSNMDLSGDYYINYVLTEDNLIYPQTGNGSCPGASNYVHDHVVKSMINGDLGELIHSGSWSTGQQVNRNLNYTVPLSPQVANIDNCVLNIFVYKLGTNISTDYYIQQSMKTPVTGVTGIVNQNTTPLSYDLSQNYPNPFNPTTNFNFSIPKSGNVSLKFYDVLGNEVQTYVDGFLTSGTYSVEFDGSNLSSGVYFYTLKADNFSETKRMVLTK
jgi:Outer membrane protein Omp28/Secretion system C-terminal sorting domain